MQQREDEHSQNKQDNTGPRDTTHVRERWPARDIDLGALSEIFFVSGVATLLLTRFYLALAGFPQVGGAGLHIAHLLWGGLLLLVALVMLLAFLGRSMQRVAALLGGVGFGLFIDELGKFLTSTNDYFFQPAVAIIYLVFVALFLTFRTIERVRRFTPRELQANAFDEAVEVVLHPERTTHRVKALSLLRASGTTGPLARGLEQALVELGAHDLPRSAQAERISYFERVSRAATRLYLRAITSRWFPRMLVTLVVVYAFVFLLLFGLELAAATVAAPVLAFDLFALRGHRFIQIGLLTSSLLAGACVVAGLVTLPRSRLRAYQWFKRGILVSLFFGQIFLFYTQQFGALVELVLSLIALVGLDALIVVERHAQILAKREEPTAAT